MSNPDLNNKSVYTGKSNTPRSNYRRKKIKETDKVDNGRERILTIYLVCEENEPNKRKDFSSSAN